MKETFRTLCRLLQMTCVALVVILLSVSALSEIPHVLEAMAYAALPAVLLAAVAETIVLGSGRGSLGSVTAQTVSSSTLKAEDMKH